MNRRETIRRRKLIVVSRVACCFRLTRSTEVRRKSASNNYPRILSVPPFSLSSVFRRRPQRERLNRFTRCFRLTRSTEDKGELCQQSFQNPRILSVSPFSRKPHYVCSVFRRRPQREHLNRCTYCFCSTRRDSQFAGVCLEIRGSLTGLTGLCRIIKSNYALSLISAICVSEPNTISESSSCSTSAPVATINSVSRFVLLSIRFIAITFILYF